MVRKPFLLVTKCTDMLVDPMVAVVVTATLIKKFTNFSLGCCAEILAVENSNL